MNIHIPKISEGKLLYTGNYHSIDIPITVRLKVGRPFYWPLTKPGSDQTASTLACYHDPNLLSFRKLKGLHDIIQYNLGLLAGFSAIIHSLGLPTTINTAPQSASSV